MIFPAASRMREDPGVAHIVTHTHMYVPVFPGMNSTVHIEHIYILERHQPRP